jgi:predicted transport protein
MSATAMGHPLMSTIHTRDCSTTIKRFMDAKVAANDLANIHLNVILEAVKTRGEPHNSMRKVKEVGEYVVGAQGVEVNRIYRLDMHTGMINRVNEPRLFYQRVMDKIGMNKDEIRQDLDEKRQILSWLVNRDVEDQHTLGMVVQTYYLHPGAVLAAASSNNDVEAFLNDDVTS